MLPGQPRKQKTTSRWWDLQGMWADNVIFRTHQSKPLVSSPQGCNQLHKLTVAFDSHSPHGQRGSSDHQEPPILVCLRPALTWPGPSLSRSPLSQCTWSCVPGLTDQINSGNKGWHCTRWSSVEVNRKHENHLLTKKAQGQEVGLGQEDWGLPSRSEATLPASLLSWGWARLQC